MCNDGYVYADSYTVLTMRWSVAFEVSATCKNYKCHQLISTYFNHGNYVYMRACLRIMHCFQCLRVIYKQHSTYTLHKVVSAITEYYLQRSVKL